MKDQRPAIILLFIFLVSGVLLVKLFAIQVLDDSFLKRAESNAIQRIVDHPYRGLVYDRTGKLMVFNNPIFDLMVVPREFNVGDTTRFCELFRISKEELIEGYNAAKSYSKVKPSPIDQAIVHEGFCAYSRLFSGLSRLVYPYPIGEILPYPHFGTCIGIYWRD